MYSVEDKKSSEKQLVSSIRCLHWMDCTSYNVQCALQAGMKSRIQFILFKLSQLITNFSLNVDVLKNFLRNMLNLWEQVLKVPNFPFVYQFRKNLESYCKQIKFRNHQRSNVQFSQSFYSSWPPQSSTSILPRTLAVHGCTAVQWFTVQWVGAATSWVRERVMRPGLFRILFTHSHQHTSWIQPY